MDDEIIGMEEMGCIFEITDTFGISREAISVPLGKEKHGYVRQLVSGEIEIVVPVYPPIRCWIPELYSELKKLGYSEQFDAL